MISYGRYVSEICFKNQGGGGKLKYWRDLVVNIEVPLEDIHTGATKKIRYKRRILDRNWFIPRICHTCNGVGSVTLMGPFKPDVIPVMEVVG